MFGNNFFGGFQNDPFFNFPQSQIMADPFFGTHSDQQIQGGRPDLQHNQLSPFGAMPGIFGNMNMMMMQMQNQMRDMQRRAEQGPPDTNGNCHFYSSSSFYSYDSRNGAEPQVYQAHSSSMAAPGGIRETRKAVKDSRSGEEKMAIGHHIGDRGHIREKRRNRRTNEEDEQEDLVNIDHDELDGFNQEWKSRTRPRHNNLALGGYSNRRDRHGHRDRRAITDRRH